MQTTAEFHCNLMQYNEYMTGFASTSIIMDAYVWNKLYLLWLKVTPHKKRKEYLSTSKMHCLQYIKTHARLRKFSDQYAENGCGKINGIWTRMTRKWNVCASIVNRRLVSFYLHKSFYSEAEQRLKETKVVHGDYCSTGGNKTSARKIEFDLAIASVYQNDFQSVNSKYILY